MAGDRLHSRDEGSRNSLGHSPAASRCTGVWTRCLAFFVPSLGQTQTQVSYPVEVCARALNTAFCQRERLKARMPRSRWLGAEINSLRARTCSAPAPSRSAARHQAEWDFLLRRLHALNPSFLSCSLSPFQCSRGLPGRGPNTLVILFNHEKCHVSQSVAPRLPGARVTVCQAGQGGGGVVCCFVLQVLRTPAMEIPSGSTSS